MAGGGAWKVAYADFVTAMMALFMVLWISSQEPKVMIATAKYFQDPFHSPMNATAGVLPFNSNKSSQGSGKDAGPDKETRERVLSRTFLNTVAAEFNRLVNLDESMQDKPIDVQVTSDGLRITLFDRPRRPMFVADTSEFTEWGRFIMQSLAWTIDRHRFRVTIDGHTRVNVPVRENYSAWELSVDRANAARRSLVHYAVDVSQIERVTGYAGTKPLAGEGPDAEANQRLTLSLSLASKSREPRASEKPPSSVSGASPPISNP